MQIYKYALESLAYVTLDTRLGCFDDPSPSVPNRRAMDGLFAFVNTFPDVLMGVPTWKIHPRLSGSFRRMAAGANDFADFTKVAASKFTSFVRDEQVLHIDLH